MCEPDLTGYEPECTYFVTWENGTEILGDKIHGKEPTDWYNYGEQRWANIVTISEGQIAYWVWIPRYKYKITYYTDDTKTTETTEITQYGTVDIKPVNTNNEYKNAQGEIEELGEEYLLPEGFDFGGKALAGMWTSKYELSATETTKRILGLNVTTRGNSITINNITSTSTVDTSTYQYYLNGQKYTGSLPYTFNNLEKNQIYTLSVIAKDTSGNYVHSYTRAMILGVDLITEPDTTGFNPECTYYVTWNEEGEEERTKITEEAPDDWYNYGEQRWANIVTENAGKTAYFVWIPRFEYKIIVNEGVITRLITTEQETPSKGYQIPEGFTFDGKILPGFWVSKYEVST